MKEDFTELYIKWLRENLKSKILTTELGQYTQITTPFLDRHNDQIQIFVKQDDGGALFLTDGGYVINDLDMCGCNVLSSPKRKIVLSSILNGFGVQMDGEQICTKASFANFAQKKHALIQAMLSVNDMFFLSRSQVSNVFLEDIQMFFDLHDIRSVPGAQYHGSSGLSHTFDFTVSASKRMPERFIKAINEVTREKIDSVLFSWSDIKGLRKPGAQLYVIMNDYEKSVREDFVNALVSYGGKPMLWSKRDDFIEELAA